MNFKKILYSPNLVPYLRNQNLNKRFNAIYIIYRDSSVDPITECVYTANSICQLYEKIRELNRVQVTMGIRINSTLDKIDKDKAFLAYKPLDGDYIIEAKNIIDNKTGKQLPIRDTRWIRHKKKGIFF